MDGCPFPYNIDNLLFSQVVIDKHGFYLGVILTQKKQCQSYLVEETRCPLEARGPALGSETLGLGWPEKQLPRQPQAPGLNRVSWPSLYPKE
ncbi:hypothetical protein ElyMa_000154900 [Elysia marginata]|uniref:Uncharacterized protein n=1 Tax=Elysia marginata TaxID=1093978 RepID=A0AAV4EQJ6_9GAST|nr:hypothetical protein ElyMa_000154900 [Elysia marginata]